MRRHPVMLFAQLIVGVVVVFEVLAHVEVILAVIGGVVVVRAIQRWRRG